MTDNQNQPVTFDVMQAEIEARASLANLKQYFGDKPFTMSQLVSKVFANNREAAQEFVENLNIFGGLVQVNSDGMAKYQIVIDIQERKKYVQQNIEEMKEHMAIIQVQLDTLLQIEAKMESI